MKDLSSIKKEDLIKIITEANNIIGELTSDLVRHERDDHKMYCCNIDAMNNGVNGKECTEVFGGCDNCKSKYYNDKKERLIKSNQVWSI